MTATCSAQHLSELNYTNSFNFLTWILVIKPLNDIGSYVHTDTSCGTTCVTIHTTITMDRSTAYGNVGIVRSEPHFFHSPNHHEICKHSVTSKQETWHRTRMSCIKRMCDHSLVTPSQHTRSAHTCLTFAVASKWHVIFPPVVSHL